MQMFVRNRSCWLGSIFDLVEKFGPRENSRQSVRYGADTRRRSNLKNVRERTRKNPGGRWFPGFSQGNSLKENVGRRIAALTPRASHFHMYSAGLEINIFSRSLQVSLSLSLSSRRRGVLLLFC